MVKISENEFSRRQDEIRKAMARDGVDVLVIGGAGKIEQRGYLRYVIDCYVQIFEELVVMPLEGPVGYFGHDRGRVRCSEGFTGVGFADFLMASDPGGKAADYAKKFRPKSVGFYGIESLSARMYRSLKEHLEDTTVRDFSKEIDGIRMIKSEEELALCEEAVRLNEKVFYTYLGLLSQGVKETDAVLEASRAAIKLGCEDQFWLVGWGPEAFCPLPLAMKRGTVSKRGDPDTIVIEHTSQGGYFGEVMHSVFAGEPTGRILRAFEILSRAQQLAGDSIQPGVAVGSVADAIDEFILENGFCKKDDVGQALGHGQGLDIAEPPTLIHGDPTIIRPGMRLNVHPFITLPSGTRVVSTDCFVATESGSQRLSSLPYEPIVL